MRKHRNTNMKALLENPDFVSLLGVENDHTVAEKFNCSIAVVFFARQSKGIEPSRKHSTHNSIPVKLDVSKEQLEEEYQELGTLQKVADKYSCSRQAVSQRLKK
nr:MAG TPA: HTH-type transcriptional regulator [Caudoviricetes sp.]